MENREHPNSTTELNNSSEHNLKCVFSLRLLHSRPVGGSAEAPTISCILDE